MGAILDFIWWALCWFISGLLTGWLLFAPRFEDKPLQTKENSTPAPIWLPLTPEHDILLGWMKPNDLERVMLHLIAKRGTFLFEDFVGTKEKPGVITREQWSRMKREWLKGGVFARGRNRTVHLTQRGYQIISNYLHPTNKQTHANLPAGEGWRKL